MKRPGVAIVGAGRIGCSLATDLAGSRRYRVRVVGHAPSPPSILRDAARVAYHVAPPPGEEIPSPALGDRDASLLVFAVPDDALREVTEAWAEALSRQGRRVDVALHTSGLHPAAALAPLREVGAAVASWHPLVAVARPRGGAFRGVTVGVEGDDAAVRYADELAERLGARPLRVAAEHKPLYHAAAVFGSNFIVACLSVALRQLAAACPEEVGLADVLPLARSAVENLVGADLASGLTGPIARGDVGTITRHLEALDPAGQAVYRALATELLDAAGDRLTGAARRSIASLLAGSPHSLSEGTEA